MIFAFYKNILFQGYAKLKNYLNHRYGQTNTRIITKVLFIIGFLIIYTLFLILWNSYKIKNNDIPINLNQKNNSTIFSTKNETIINTNIMSNINLNYTNNINSNNQMSNISSNFTNEKNDLVKFLLL